MQPDMQLDAATVTNALQTVLAALQAGVLRVDGVALPAGLSIGVKAASGQRRATDTKRQQAAARQRRYAAKLKLTRQQASASGESQQASAERQLTHVPRASLLLYSSNI